ADSFHLRALSGKPHPRGRALHRHAYSPAFPRPQRGAQRLTMARKRSTVTYYLETAPGLEEVAWLEIRRRLPQVEHVAFLYAEDQHGIVVFRYAGDPADLFTLRTAEALYLLVAYLPNLSRGYRDLRELSERMTRSGDLAGAVNRYSRIRRRRPQ